jgi:hypothetical protein
MTRGLSRNAFDLPVAALAGLAAAVIAFAMPADLLGRLVSATGLPHLLAAAEPPLGLKARGMIGIAGAAAAFGLVYMLLRLLDRSGREKARPEPEPEMDEDRPRLRRRDIHPDAPVCRPISATRDFGEPAPPAPLERDEEPVPVWLAAAEAETPDPRPEPAVDERRPGFRRRDVRHDTAARQSISAVWDPDEPAPGMPEPAAPQFAERCAEPAHAQVEEAPAAVHSAEAEEPLEPTARPAPDWLAGDELQPEPPALEPQAEPAAEASLAHLMGRLEQGLARRREREAFATTRQQHAAPQVFPEANDDRLQSAIESLQRFAARGE